MVECQATKLEVPTAPLPQTQSEAIQEIHRKGRYDMMMIFIITGGVVYANLTCYNSNEGRLKKT